MKNKLMMVAGLGALAMGLMVAQNPPQDPAQNAQQKGARRAMGQRRANFGRHMARVLNLTPDQRVQMKQIMTGARQEALPLRQQMQQNRKALADAIKAGNDAQIDQITKAAAPIQAQLASIRARAMGKIYATLTPEQKTKADQMPRFTGPRAHRKQAG